MRLIFLWPRVAIATPRAGPAIPFVPRLATVGAAACSAAATTGTAATDIPSTVMADAGHVDHLPGTVRAQRGGGCGPVRT